MGASFIVAPEAEQDLTEVYDWYEARRTGLGEDFLGCVDACFERIRRTPGLYSLAFGNYRRALVRRFPYLVIYEVESESITVYGVFHMSRDSNVWRLRLP